MKYYFLSGLFPTDFYDQIIEDSIGTIQYAADALQKSFVEGFSEVLPNLELVNFPLIEPYPKRYKRMFINFPDSEYISGNGRRVTCHNPAFCNLYEYKKTSLENSAYKFFLKELRTNDDPICIIIYSITTSMMNACLRLKRRFGVRVKTVLIITDFPQFTYNNKKYFRRLYFEKYQRKIYEKGYEGMDAFVLLSRNMTELLPKRPWVVVEGIFNPCDDIIEIDNKDNAIRSICYAGTISIQYGIKDLVDAFMKTSNSNYRLIICGSGDAKKYIEECAKKDQRIVYKGQIKREQALALQRKATLLVNPRTSKGEYTKYSFPSKTMEYLASGIPALIYRLPGIPEDYYSYCYSMKEENVDSFSLHIDTILSTDIKQLSELGKKAREFIIKNKNPITQCSKVKELIDSL